MPSASILITIQRNRSRKMLPVQQFLRNSSRSVAPVSKYYSNGINISKQSTKLMCTKNGTVRTVGEAMKHWSHRFEDEGVTEPVESIEHIVAHVLETRKVMDLVNREEEKLTPEQRDKLRRLCECRLSRMPVQYIIGEWDFRDITLKTVPPVFIPRPETEILVDFVLKRVASEKPNACKILEIGCGSGAVSLALVHACDKIRSVAIDKSRYACSLTRLNAESLGLEERLEILNATLRENGTIELSKDSECGIDFDTERFDFVVSNPPYVPTPKLFELAPEIKIYEDLRALDGGKDGLNVIKPLLKYAAKALKPGGRLFIEVDPTHPEYVRFFTQKYTDLKLKHEHTYKDFCNNDRFVEVLKLC